MLGLHAPVTHHAVIMRDVRIALGGVKGVHDR